MDKKPANEFVYKKARQECIGKSDLWVMQATNEILTDLTAQINAENKAPESEQLDRIESTLQALKDELRERGVPNKENPKLRELSKKEWAHLRKMKYPAAMKKRVKVHSETREIFEDGLGVQWRMPEGLS